MGDKMIVAQDAWDNTPPDWIVALATTCDQTSQNKASTRLGISASTVSQLLRNKYPGNMARMEERIRSALMQTEIRCPALGKISGEACLKWRDRSKGLSSASPLVVGMFRSCRNCPLNCTTPKENQL